MTTNNTATNRPTKTTTIDLASDRDVVVAALHWNGALYGRLNDHQVVQCRRMADGFGDGLFDAPPSSWSEETRDMFWDWSSIRDSSDDAMEAMADYIRRKFRIMPIQVGDRVSCDYRVGSNGRPHIGTVIGVDHIRNDLFLVEWDFGSQYWDKNLRHAMVR